MTLQKTLLFTFLVSTACNHIETGETLKQVDIDRIEKLNLLDKNERIYQYYSEFKKSVAGNFYTDKRLASYWIDEKDTTKNKIEFAYYQDIAKIDTVYNSGHTYCPYLLITRNDSSNFKVCVDGKQNEVTNFFKDAISIWRSSKK